MTKEQKIEEARRYISHARRAADEGALNIAELESSRARFNAEMASVGWQAFVRSGQYHYFVARVLLSQQVHLYGLFCAHQCVENYLKAYHVSLQRGAPPTIHELNKLLSSIRGDHSGLPAFVASSELETICRKFDPFYEIGRYPVQVSRPKGGRYVAMPSLDMSVLDYFVHQMSELLPLGPKEWNILGLLGHMDLEVVRDIRPEFYALFTDGNLNFL